MSCAGLSYHLVRFFLLKSTGWLGIVNACVLNVMFSSVSFMKENVFRCIGGDTLCCLWICPKNCELQHHFYAPGLKGPPGASTNWIIRLSVRLSVCLSI